MTVIRFSSQRTHDPPRARCPCCCAQHGGHCFQCPEHGHELHWQTVFKIAENYRQHTPWFRWLVYITALYGVFRTVRALTAFSVWLTS